MLCDDGSISPPLGHHGKTFQQISLYTSDSENTTLSIRCFCVANKCGAHKEWVSRFFKCPKVSRISRDMRVI